MESVPKVTTFGIKMMVKSGLEIFFFEIPPCVKRFSDLLIYLLKGGGLPQITKFSNKKCPMFGHGGISILLV